MLLAICLTADLSAQGDCPKELQLSSPDVNRLIALVEQGHEQKTDVAFRALCALDGGDLEDVMRALAGLSATHPDLFLTMLKKHDWPPSRIERLVVMLPLETVDEPEEQIRVVEQRIEAIRGVPRTDLGAVRCVTLDALTKNLAKRRLSH